MKSIKVNTSTRKYRILFGNDIFRDISHYLKNEFSGAHKIIVVSNETIFGIYGEIFNDVFSGETGFSKIILKDGEKYKNIDVLKSIYSELISLNAHRNDILVSIGGGVIGDTAGFAAATFNRGMNLVQVPTTVIAQTDSSIGGKVAINFENIKNVIGSFYQPHLIIIDTFFLKTLSEKEIINGMGEIVKYGLVFDYRIIKDILELSKKTGNDDDRLYKIIRNEKFNNIIYKCAKIKSEIVKKDEFDLKERQLLNFGHTIGHALEKAAGFEILNHGQAVAIGMLCAVDISINLGMLNKDFKNELVKLYEILKLPVYIKNIDKEKIFDSLKFDKKFVSDINRYILLENINKPVIMAGIDEIIIKKSIINYIK
jgi:3-dehydroquinate synthase